VIVSAALALGAAVAAPAWPAGIGTLAVCNASSLSVPLSFSLVAPASESGTQVVLLSPGQCSGRFFYDQGLVVTVIENVPAGSVVSQITIAGQSRLVGPSPVAGQTGVVVGDGDSQVIFTTRAAGASSLRACVVPRVAGLSLAAARSALKRGACRAGGVTYVWSSRYPKGGVTKAKPKAGARLAHGAKVRLWVSKGPKG
jgi:hypothetical protein